MAEPTPPPAPQPAKANTTERGTALVGYAGESAGTDFLEANPSLRWPLSVSVYDEMRRQDAQVVSTMRAIKLPIRRAKWQIDPADADEQVVAFVAGELGLPIAGRDPVRPARTRDRFSWADHLRHALLCLDFGYSYFEQVYRIEERDGRLWARLRKLGPRLPQTISKVNVAADGGLESVQQWNLTAGTMTKPIPVSALVAYTNEREGANWLGQSLLRSAYKNWILKDQALRTWAVRDDRNGMGVPVYTAAPGETDLGPGTKLAQNVRSGATGGAAVANGASLGFEGVSGQLADPEKQVRYHDEQIARGVLAHFLNLGTQTGSWALGSTFADFFTMSLQAVADEIADTATQHIVEDLVDLNFGTDVPAPKVMCEPIGSRKDATAEAIKILRDAGVLSTDEDLDRFVREIYGLPAPKPGAQPAPAPTTEQETP